MVASVALGVNQRQVTELLQIGHLPDPSHRYIQNLHQSPILGPRQRKHVSDGGRYAQLLADSLVRKRTSDGIRIRMPS